MALQNTMIIARSAGDGPNGKVLVARNAAVLAAAIDASQETWSVSPNPFATAQDVWIGEEKLTVGNPTSAVARGQDLTTGAIHPIEAAIHPDGYGTKILDYTAPVGDAGKTITAIRGDGDAPGQFTVVVNSAVVAEFSTTELVKNGFWPWSGSELLEDDHIEVYVRNWYAEALYWAEIVA
jgi:hypothetical protein